MSPTLAKMQKECHTFVLCLIDEFPGLADGRTPINGADLVDYISGSLRSLPTTTRFAKALKEIGQCAATATPRKNGTDAAQRRPRTQRSAT